MKKKYDVIRTALEDHLKSINENSTEIQALFDYFKEFEIKVERLSQRLDQLQLNNDQPLENNSVLPLNAVEKKVFLVLYTEETPLSYPEIAQRTSQPIMLIPELISSLTNKGIPFARSFVNNQVFLKIDSRFKERQAKENLVNLSLQSFM